jgi:trans-aconitate methyltransferase
MSKWSDFYAKRVGDSYTKYARQRYAPHIEAIQSLIKPNMTVTEVGCGIGTITKCLFSKGNIRYVATDLDPDMLSLAKRNLGTGVSVRRWSAFVPLEADIIHGHGLLEHFYDNEIERIIAAHARKARCAVHYVPGAAYKSPSFGDERLLTAADWKRIAHPDKIIEFNDGYDYCLMWNFK